MQFFILKDPLNFCDVIQIKYFASFQRLGITFDKKRSLRFLSDESEVSYFKLSSGSAHDRTGKSVSSLAFVIPNDAPIAEPFKKIIQVIFLIHSFHIQNTIKLLKSKYFQL